MSLKNKHIGVLVEDLYEDLELWYQFYGFARLAPRLR
jgi:hypothetical protein